MIPGSDVSNKLKRLLLIPQRDLRCPGCEVTMTVTEHGESQMGKGIQSHFVKCEAPSSLYFLGASIS